MADFKEILKQRFSDRVSNVTGSKTSPKKLSEAQKAANEQMREVRRLQRLKESPKVIKIRMNRALAMQKKADKIRKSLKP